MLAELQRNANVWFELALGRAPVELYSTLQASFLSCPHIVQSLTASVQKYLAVNQVLSATESSELGASLALQYGKAVGPIDRKLSTCLR